MKFAQRCTYALERASKRVGEASIRMAEVPRVNRGVAEVTSAYARTGRWDPVIGDETERVLRTLGIEDPDDRASLLQDAVSILKLLCPPGLSRTIADRACSWSYPKRQDILLYRGRRPSARQRPWASDSRGGHEYSSVQAVGLATAA